MRAFTSGNAGWGDLEAASGNDRAKVTRQAEATGQAKHSRQTKATHGTHPRGADGVKKLINHFVDAIQQPHSQSDRNTPILS
jgi:hypothetical protein